MATLGKEILVTASNKVGTLFRVTAPLKEAGIGIQAVCAWGEGDKACLLIVTENNERAEQAFKKAGLSTLEKEVVLAELTHKTGTLAEAAQRLADANIDIDHCYVSATGSKALAVFATKDNQKAVKVLS